MLYIKYIYDFFKKSNKPLAKNSFPIITIFIAVVFIGLTHQTHYNFVVGRPINVFEYGLILITIYLSLNIVIAFKYYSEALSPENNKVADKKAKEQKKEIFNESRKEEKKAKIDYTDTFIFNKLIKYDYMNERLTSLTNIPKTDPNDHDNTPLTAPDTIEDDEQDDNDTGDTKDEGNFPQTDVNINEPENVVEFIKNEEDEESEESEDEKNEGDFPDIDKNIPETDPNDHDNSHLEAPDITDETNEESGFIELSDEEKRIKMLKDFETEF